MKTRTALMLRGVIAVGVMVAWYAVSDARASNCEDCRLNSSSLAYCPPGTEWSSCSPSGPIRCLVTKGSCAGRPGFEGEEGEVDGLPET